MVFLRSSLVVALVCAACAALAQGRLIGVNGSTLYEISMTDASLTPLATLTSGAGTIGELSYDWNNGVLYMSSTSGQNLYRLNLDGTWTTLGAYGLATNPVMHGLEYNSTNNHLYGASGGSSHGYHLYDINPATGAATFIGSTGLISFANLGYNSATGVMYLTNSDTDSLYTINLATGAPTLVGSLGGPTNPNSLAFNRHTNTMYMLDNNTDLLYTVNLATGQATAVGSLGSSNFLAMTYVPVPEPATLGALGLGIVALLRRRRR